MDEDERSELFVNYEVEFKLVMADVNQKLDLIPELNAKDCKTAIKDARRALNDCKSILDQMRIEKQNIAAPTKTKINQRFRSYQNDVEELGERLDRLGSDRAALLGHRYMDEPTPSKSTDEFFEQRQQLLSGTEIVDRTTERIRESQRIALQTEEIGANTLADLERQRETIIHSRDVLLQSERYTNRSIQTLKKMAWRMAANRVITIAIIVVLVLLILAVVVSKFR